MYGRGSRRASLQTAKSPRNEPGNRGHLGCLEDGLSVGPDKRAVARRAFDAWARAEALEVSEITSVARSAARTPLRFSSAGDAEMESVYRKLWTSAALTGRKRAALVAESAAPPELVAVESEREWSCHRCGGTGDFLVMEAPGTACLPCLGFGDLVFLPSGDATRTRRARAKSMRNLVVVRWSSAQKGYRRIGTLVEPAALESEAE